MFHNKMEAEIAPRLLAVPAVFRDGSGRTGSALIQLMSFILRFCVFWSRLS